MASQVENGKSFEYACAKMLMEMCQARGVRIHATESPSWFTAKGCYDNLDEVTQEKYDEAARVALEYIFNCEPNLNDQDDPKPLWVSIQSDDKGTKGDVRDVIASRRAAGALEDSWAVGISCKHNHDALKHPRINFQPPAKDIFESSWAPSYKVDPAYINACHEAARLCESGIAEDKAWRHFFSPEELHAHIYKPINDGLMKSIDQYKNDPVFVQEFFKYCLGLEDFYKVMMHEAKGFTKVTVFNFLKTLGKPSKNIKKGRFKLAPLKIPQQIISVALQKDSTFHVNFDEGWAFSFRLHSADTTMKYSGLKYDVRLLGVPLDSHNLIFPW